MITARSAFLIVLLLAGSAVSSGCGKKETPSGSGASIAGTPNSPASQNQSAPPVATKISAENLAKEFLADPKAAFEKYNGKVVEVEGIVDSANKIVNNDRGFLIAGAKKDPKDILGLSLSCNTVPEQADKVWWLGKGQKVKVVGEVFDANNVFVSLKDCRFTEVEKSPTPAVSAKQLAEDFTKDEVAAKDKYLSKDFSPREIIVSGVVAALDEKNGFSFVTLEGAGSVVISCTVDKKDYAAVKKGDKVTMKGDLSIAAFDKKDNKVTMDTAFLLKKD